MNASSQLPVTVKTRAVQEKFNNMLKEFHTRDSKDRKKSCAADDMCQEDELPNTMYCFPSISKICASVLSTPDAAYRYMSRLRLISGPCR